MEQTKSKSTVKTLLAAVLTFVVTLAMVFAILPATTLTAYADNTETLLTTITATDKEQASYSVENIATVSFSYTTEGSSAYLANWGWWGYGWSATVNAAEGYTITKCVFYDDANRTATDTSSPFVVETTEEDKTPRINGTPIDGGNYQSKGIKKIEVYGYATPALDPVSYMAWNGTTLVEKTGDDACTDYTVVTADTTTFEDGKWYVVSNSVTVSSRITVTGTAHLILCDGAILTASKGITVNSGNTINIYAQIGGTGELNAGSDTNVASIGGGARYQSGGTVNIHGGKITATGGTNASGIGGALDGGNGEVNVYGGEVIARGQNFAAGIGGYSGKSGGTVNIYGGTVNASGSQYGTTGIGIGGIKPGSCVVHIYGGEVTAISEKAAAMQGTITIDGGTVTANGGGVSDMIDGSSGETYSSNGINGTVTVNGGTVTAFGGNVTFTGGYAGAIESYGGTIYACSGISGTVTISGGTVVATGGNVTGDINNYGGTIYACNGVNGTVTISGGTVTATGGSHTGNSSGTTVKEKGFGGSLTLGTGMYLYGGTSANPESDLSNYRAGAGDYAGDRYVYMTVNNVVPHIHSFTYTATGATITAACTAGCDITEGLALTISAPTELTYDGSAKAATLSTGYNTTAFPGEYMIKYYKGANEVEAANVKAAGDYTAKVTVGEATASVDFTIAKATPSIETIPTASAVTYGQKLADSTLTNGVAKLGDNTVEGKFTWKSTETKPSVSDSNITEYAVMFNPTDTDNYAAVECKVKLTVNRAEPTVTVPTAKTPTYNGSAQELVNAGSATGGTMYYAVTTENMAPTDENLYTTYIPTATNAGIYYVWYKIAGDENHNDTNPACVEVTINKANPTYTVPTDLNATYGDTLADVALPTGWAWADNTASVGNAGTNTFAATFTPEDTANYNTVEQNLSVTVDKATPSYTVPTDLVATYGDTLADVALPTGWAWADNTAGVGNAGTNTFKANFTPADNANYNMVNNVDVTVTVVKADPTYTIPSGLTATYGDTLVDVVLPTGWAWADNTASVGNAGTNTFKANFTPADTANYNTVNNVDVTITVVKADPTYTIPSGLTATYGDTLSSVTLPEGWTWTEPTTSVGTVGSHTFAATFTPDNTDNYNTVKENLTVTVNANDKSALIAAIGSASEYYDSISVDYPDIAATLQNAIDVATSVKNDDNKTEAEISDAVTALNSALDQAKADENQAKADEVKALITAIGTVEYTTESKGKIDEAKAAYATLSEAQKALVTNYSELTSAESTYATLQAAAEKAEADQAAANAVKEKIAAIGTVEYNTESKGKINEAREAYDALTADQKALVDTYETLTTAESTYATLKADNDAANATKALIDAIGTVELTVNSKAVIDLARESYDGLTAEQKALVLNYNVLTAAEVRYADLRAADEAKTLIDAIGDVTYSTESKGKIDAARAAYNALTPEQQALVPNYETLTSAEGNYTDLKAVKEAEDAVSVLPASDDITVTDKAAVAAAKAKYDALTPAQKATVSAETVAKLSAASNMVAAQEVVVSIGNIDADNPDSAKVTEARAAYDALTDEQKAKVTNYESLTAAESKLIEINNPEKKGLSGGAIAGIVIAFVVVLSVIGLLVFSYLKQRKNEKK